MLNPEETTSQASILEQKCSTFFPRVPKENLRGAVCSDMFSPGDCQFYNLSTGQPLNALYFQPEICDFTSHDLSLSDKLALASLVLAVVAFIFSLIGGSRVKK